MDTEHGDDASFGLNASNSLNDRVTVILPIFLVAIYRECIRSQSGFKVGALQNTRSRPKVDEKLFGHFRGRKDEAV